MAFSDIVTSPTLDKNDIFSLLFSVTFCARIVFLFIVTYVELGKLQMRKVSA